MKNQSYRFLSVAAICGAFRPSAALSAPQWPSVVQEAPHWLTYVFDGLAIVGVGVCAVAAVLAIRKVFRFFFPPPPNYAPNYAPWRSELQRAFKLSLKTDSFSEAACQGAASQNREALLAAHDRIEQKEASRRLAATTREEHYQAVATWAAPSSGLEIPAIIDVLRNADVWEYRTLVEAKKQAMEVAHA